MAEFHYRVRVVADSQEQADQVMRERINYDEEYTEVDGIAVDPFDYSIEFEAGEVWEHNGDPSVAINAGRYLLVRLPDE